MNRWMDGWMDEWMDAEICKFKNGTGREKIAREMNHFIKILFILFVHITNCLCISLSSIFDVRNRSYRSLSRIIRYHYIKDILSLWIAIHTMLL